MFQVRLLLCAGEALQAGANRRGTLDLLFSGAQPLPDAEQPHPDAGQPQVTPAGTVVSSNTPDQLLLAAADGTLVAPAAAAGRSPLLGGASTTAVLGHQPVQEPPRQALAAEQDIRVGLQAAKPRAKGLQGLANRLAGQQSIGKQTAKAPGRGLAAAEAKAGGAPPTRKSEASPAAAKPDVGALSNLLSSQAPASAQHLRLPQRKLQQPAASSEQELSGELSFGPAVVESPSQGAADARADRSTLDMLFAPGLEVQDQLSKVASARSVKYFWCSQCTLSLV